MSSGFTQRYKNQNFKVFKSVNPMDDNIASLDGWPTKEVKKMMTGLSVDYFRVVECKFTEPRQGCFPDVRHNIGLIGLAEFCKVSDMDKAYKEIESLRKTENNWYCGFGIRKTEYNPKTDTFTSTVIQPCEYVNASVLSANTIDLIKKYW